MVTLSVQNAFALDAFDSAEFVGLSGQIASNGTLTLPAGAGQTYYRDAQGVMRWMPSILEDWQASVSDGAMSGSFRFSARFEDRNLTIAGTLSNVSRLTP